MYKGAKMEKVSVFLADWQVLFREGIHFTLSGEEDVEVIGEAASNEEALDFIEKNPPRIAILNANHREFTGIHLTHRIQQNLPAVSVILIMDSYNEEQLFSAMKCGASACVTKDIDPDELVKLIRNIAQGAKPISEALLRPGIAPRVIDEFENFSLISKEVDNLLGRLSPRESEILHSITNGNSIEQLSSALGISEEVIRRHLDLILTKLVSNEHNREVIEAAQKGLSSVISRARRGKSAEQYITKSEFDAFKESLKERFKSLTGELD
jgi:DNA-binding NarL/FixJ family response regulator